MAAEEKKVRKRGLADYMVIFFILNTFYAITLFLTHKYIKAENSPFAILKNKRIITAVYLVIVFFTMKLVNDTEVKKEGREKDPLWLTVHPMVLVLVPVVGILNFHKTMGNSLKRPFEETIGYPIIKLLGSKQKWAELDGKIEVKSSSTRENDNNISAEVNKINEDMEVKIRNIVKRKMDEDTEAVNGINNIKQLYKLKRIISEFIWLTLAGAIVSNITVLSLDF